jgi:hypothetical protein
VRGLGFINRFRRPKPRPRFAPVVADVPLAGDDQVFRASAFPVAGPAPWLDRPDAPAAIERKRERREISESEASFARAWASDGFVVLERFFESARLDAAWTAYERALTTGEVVPDAPPTEADPLPGRTLNPHFRVPELAALLAESSVVGLVAFLLGAEALPFQTIMGHKGSEQRAHSDAIHMTTYPLGYLAAAWIAFEDIGADAGPVMYYPGSHRLPYVFSDDVGISTEEFAERGYAPYHERYEPRIRALIEAHALEPRYFTPRKGDVLLWHANMLHGGSPRTRRSASRRALVCHYFARGCVTYHDLAAGPSHLYLQAR